MGPAMGANRETGIISPIYDVISPLDQPTVQRAGY